MNREIIFALLSATTEMAADFVARRDMVLRMVVLKLWRDRHPTAVETTADAVFDCSFGLVGGSEMSEHGSIGALGVSLGHFEFACLPAAAPCEVILRGRIEGRSVSIVQIFSGGRVCSMMVSSSFFGVLLENTELLSACVQRRNLKLKILLLNWSPIFVMAKLVVAVVVVVVASFSSGVLRIDKVVVQRHDDKI